MSSKPTLLPALAPDEREASERLEEEELLLPSPLNPARVARTLIAERFSTNGEMILRHWRGGWWEWQRSHWQEREPQSVRADAWAFTEHATFVNKDGVLEPWAPNHHKIMNVLEAMAAVTHLPERVDQPSWIAGDGPSVVAVRNGLLNIERRELLAHSPKYFNQTAVPFDYDPTADCPTWGQFLSELWADDEASAAALAEWFGYVVSGRLDLHKILLMVGPTRGGKGTIARLLGKMIDPENVAGPTLSSLNHDFGMAPLIGKPLAVISDARLDARSGTSVVVERLLAISGEDRLTVNIKHRQQWNGKLPTRFFIISNELPRLGDDSGTIANRFVVLLLSRSWLGREDTGLEDRLTAELPGILNWSLKGLDRLVEQGRFTRPASTDEAIIALQDLASPVAAFVRDRCDTGPMCEVGIDTLYTTWKAWADDNGQKPGSRQMLGRNLRAVVPPLKVKRPREGTDDERERVYVGIALKRWHSSGPDRGPSRTTDPETPSGPQWSATQPTAAAPVSQPLEERTNGHPRDEEIASP